MPLMLLDRVDHRPLPHAAIPPTTATAVNTNAPHKSDVPWITVGTIALGAVIGAICGVTMPPPGRPIGAAQAIGGVVGFLTGGAIGLFAGVPLQNAAT